MPMDFPDLKSLRSSFDSKDRLPYKEGEPEAKYRERCAVYMETVWKDTVEAQEIRSGKGWDRWGDKDVDEAVKKHPDPISNPMLLTKMIERGKRKS